jgi:hypothetical protein
MAINTSEIRVGVSGSVFVAPTTTDAPVDATTELDSDFVDLGAINEDGLALAPTRSIEKVRAWQSAKAVRTIITEDELSISFSLQQWNEESIALAFGGGTWTDESGATKFVPPAAGTVDERSFVFEWVDGSIKSRLYVPRGMVSEVGSITVAKSGAIELALTVEVLGSTPDDFVYLTNDFLEAEEPAGDPEPEGGPE